MNEKNETVNIENRVEGFQKTMLEDYQTLLSELTNCISNEEKTDELKLQEINAMLDKRMNSILKNSKSVLMDFLQALAEIEEIE